MRKYIPYIWDLIVYPVSIYVEVATKLHTIFIYKYIHLHNLSYM